MWPPIYTFVQPLPVVCLEIGRVKPNRKARRSARYGKQSTWDRLDGKISPKHLREATQ